MSKRNVQTTLPEVPRIPATDPAADPQESKTADAAETKESKTAPAVEAKKATPEAKSPSVVDVELRLPLGELPQGSYISRHCEVNHLTPSQAAMLRRITLGLMLQGATLRNGKPVQSTPDAIRFMLEKLIADVKQ